MNNYQLHKKLNSELISLLDIRLEMNMEDKDFYSKAVSIEASIKIAQTAIDDIEWTQEEIDDAEDYKEPPYSCTYCC
tara:strand:- start:804 stop:1034 length:231 start_codon:yes stop_codon:yes gene_type:complete